MQIRFRNIRQYLWARTHKNALTLAAEEGNLAQVNRLLNNRFYQPFVARNLEYAMQTAAMQGRFDIVNQLLDTQGALAKANANGSFILRFAIKHNDEQMITRLLNNPNVVSDLNINVLYTSCAFGRVELLEELLKYPQVQAQISEGDFLSYRLAAQKGHRKTVGLLIDHLYPNRSLEDLPASIREDTTIFNMLKQNRKDKEQTQSIHAMIGAYQLVRSKQAENRQLGHVYTTMISKFAVSRREDIEKAKSCPSKIEAIRTAARARL